MKNNKISSAFLKLVDGSSIATFRILFGLILLSFVLKFQSPDELYIKYAYPDFFTSFSLFNYFGIQYPSPQTVRIIFASLAVSALCITLGLFFRLACGLFFILFSYLFLMEKAYYHDHHYLVLLILGLLFFSSAHKCWSVDAIWRPHLNTQRVSNWIIFLFRFQFFVVLIYSALALLSIDFLSGRVLYAYFSKLTQYPHLKEMFYYNFNLQLLTCIILLWNFIPLLFLVNKQLRILGISLLISYQLIRLWAFDLDIAPFLMMSSAVLFLDPDTIRKWINQFRKDFDMKPLDLPPVTGNTQSKKRIVMPLLCIYVFFQIAIPLRHFLIKSDVNWSLEGSRFAWREAVNFIRADLRFTVINPDTLESKEIYPDELPSYGQRVVSETNVVFNIQPDIIHQYAQYLSEKFKNDHGTSAFVNAHVPIEFNGREARYFIDETIDLAQQEYKFLEAAAWINPHPDKQNPSF